MARKRSKRSVNYRQQVYRWGQRRCGNCSMFVPRGSVGSGSCTLVSGVIRRQDICDRWEAR